MAFTEFFLQGVHETSGEKSGVTPRPAALLRLTAAWAGCVSREAEQEWVRRSISSLRRLSGQPKLKWR